MSAAAGFADWGTKPAISELRVLIGDQAWTPQRNFVNTQPTAKRWRKCLMTAKLRLYGNGWRRDGSFEPNWRKTRTRSSVVAWRRITQSCIRIPTSGANSPDHAQDSQASDRQGRPWKLGRPFHTQIGSAYPEGFCSSVNWITGRCAVRLLSCQARTRFREGKMSANSAVLVQNISAVWLRNAFAGSLAALVLVLLLILVP